MAFIAALLAAAQTAAPAALTVGTGLQIAGALKARREEKKAAAAQQRIEMAAALKQRREQIRSAQIQRAQILNASAQTGTLGSSGQVGAVSSLNSQVGSNLAFSQFTQDLSLFAGKHLRSASDWATLSNIGSSVASVGATFYSPTPQVDTTPPGQLTKPIQ